jgi:rod shape-determining protein MreD
VRPAAYALVGLLLAAVQAAALRWVGGGTIPVQLLVPVVAWLALEAEHVEGVVAAAAVGWEMDLFAGTPDGLFTFLAVAFFLLGRAAGAAVDLRGRAGLAVLSGLGCLAISLGAVWLQRWAGAAEAAPGALLLPRILGEAALTGLAGPLVGLGLTRLDTLLGREEPGLVP